MLRGIKAVIFDMDGVLIDSEPLWRRVMIQSFNEIGIPLTEEDCKTTTGSRFIEVIKYWFEKYQFHTLNPKDFEDLVVSRLCELIKIEGKLMPGVIKVLDFLKNKSFKLAIATSSNEKLLKTVITELNIQSYFHTTCSAEYLKYGKPHPEVFLNCANNLGVIPSQCLVIEDSVNGVIAAKAAQMKVIVVPDEHNFNNPKFSIADYKLPSLTLFISN
ncbi:MAG: hexitol phosphatase HxpB [Bacteroidia bacterium]|nr:hexitol phosphatase HxpB [Bacteroidia bacterium]